MRVELFSSTYIIWTIVLMYYPSVSLFVEDYQRNSTSDTSPTEHFVLGTFYVVYCTILSLSITFSQ